MQRLTTLFKNNYTYFGIITTKIVIAIFVLLFFRMEKAVIAKSHVRVQNQSLKIQSDQIIESNYAPFTTLQKNLIKGKAIHVPILMYHHVGIAPQNADVIHKGLTLNLTEFEIQVKWLKENGYSSVTLNSLYNEIQYPNYNWPKKPVIFTFDDGYADVFENAIPILKKYGFTGSFAVITSFAGQIQGDNSYATWQQIQSAKQNGMEIVCHTQNHFDGSSSKFTAEYIYTNLVGCQNDLKEKLNSNSPPYIVYPYGHFTPTYITQAQNAGFKMGITVHEGSYINTDDLMRIPRVRVNPGETLANFIYKLG